MTGTRKNSNKLKMAEQYKLIGYVQTQYVTADMHDPEFAEKATAELGFQVTAGNIQGVRTEFGIEATKLKRLNATPELIIDRLEKLEAQMGKVKEILAKLGEKV